MKSLAIKKTFRSIWISDVHLGTKDCRAEYLQHFLSSTHSEALYLVGDIIDIEKIKKSTFFWPKEHNKVLKMLFDKAQNGTKVIYIPGNHDDVIREYVGHEVAGIQIKRNHLHVTAEGRRLLVSHGDEFDFAIRTNVLLHLIGHYGYGMLLALSRLITFLRNRLNLHYWSLAAFIKHNFGKANHYIGKFEHAAAHEAAHQNLDGFICGHIHRAGMRDIRGVTYCNTGDWVENCTALVEHHNGELEVLHWAEVVKDLAYTNREKNQYEAA